MTPPAAGGALTAAAGASAGAAASAGAPSVAEPSTGAASAAGSAGAAAGFGRRSVFRLRLPHDAHERGRLAARAHVELFERLEVERLERLVFRRAGLLAREVDASSSFSSVLSSVTMRKNCRLRGRLLVAAPRPPRRSPSRPPRPRPSRSSKLKPLPPAPRNPSVCCRRQPLYVPTSECLRVRRSTRGGGANRFAASVRTRSALWARSKSLPTPSKREC